MLDDFALSGCVFTESACVHWPFLCVESLARSDGLPTCSPGSIVVRSVGSFAFGYCGVQRADRSPVVSAASATHAVSADERGGRPACGRSSTGVPPGPTTGSARINFVPTHGVSRRWPGSSPPPRPSVRNNGTVPTRIHAIQWRADDDVLAFKMAGGRVVGQVASLGFDDILAGLAFIELRPWHRQLIFEFVDGYGFNCELGTARDLAPLRARPVVYLDQNQWSTMSKAIFAPYRVSDVTERTAARRLLEMAEAGSVILPLSAAHLAETGAWSNDVGRRELARTILAGSRGWQMRDALAVRAHEFQATLAGFAGLAVPSVPAVFTLEPYAALDPNARRGGHPDLPPDLPDSWRTGYLSTLSNVVYASCMLDRDPTPQGSVDGWLERVQLFATWLANERQRTKDQRRRSAQVFAASDITSELARAAIAVGATIEQVSAWTRQAWDQPALGAPAISLFRAAMVDKLLAGASWEGNDLTDLMYLCSAAGYADHVVAERRTIGLLRQATSRLNTEVGLHTRIAPLVDELVGCASG